MELSLFSPPVAVLIVFFVVVVEYQAAAALQLDATYPEEEGKLEPYACGEEVTERRWRSDYSQFFSFAFFFTIMHVVALVVATVPTHDKGATVLAFSYLLASVVALFILFRR